ncbi:MAG TPA: DUF998 domain-containing protein [Pseudonocardiaceae bacterium]|nr:DUF998 domain-containing protein [Pseudonocardiaceae bacterium]
MNGRAVLLVGGVLAGPLFTLAWVVGEAITPRYSAMRNLVSELALGRFGWLPEAGFYVSGVLVLGLAFGLWWAFRPVRLVWAPIIIGLVGLSLIGAGHFQEDPANGFPPGTPVIPTTRTMHGELHDVFGDVIIYGLPIAALLFLRAFHTLGRRAWLVYSLVTGLATFVVSFVAKLDPRDVAEAGLQQRIGLTIDFLWLTLVAAFALRTDG